MSALLMPVAAALATFFSAGVRVVCCCGLGDGGFGASPSSFGPEFGSHCVEVCGGGGEGFGGFGSPAGAVQGLAE
jgi:hypothetical protein